jgi:hypothetical protein
LMYGAGLRFSNAIALERTNTDESYLAGDRRARRPSGQKACGLPG